MSTGERRPLGRSGLSIAPLVLGCNVFGWTADIATSFRILDHFMASGFNAIDTSDVYGAPTISEREGPSELIIGEWLKRRRRREDVVLATKVGMWPKRPGLRAANIIAAVEDSLRRLQTDYIDLYQSHQDDPETPQDETLDAYAKLIAAGKVRAAGASNFDARRLGEALDLSRELGVARYESLQPPYSLIDRGFEVALDPICRANGVGVLTYYSLARGFLTGKYRSHADLAKSERGAGNAKYLSEENMRVLSAMDEVAARTGATVGQVAVAWVVARPGVTAPIISVTSPEQLDQIVAAVRLRLDDEAMRALDDVSAGFVREDGASAAIWKSMIAESRAAAAASS